MKNLGANSPEVVAKEWDDTMENRDKYGDLNSSKADEELDKILNELFKVAGGTDEDKRNFKVKAKNIMQTMDKNNTNDIVFTIGEENLDKKYSDYSIIQANYTLGNGVVTKIGVLGPERMDYAKIASALKYVVDEMKKS